MRSSDSVYYHFVYVASKLSLGQSGDVTKGMD